MAEAVSIVTLMRFPVKPWQSGRLSSGHFGKVTNLMFSCLCHSSVWTDKLLSFITEGGIAQSVSCAAAFLHYCWGAGPSSHFMERRDALLPEKAYNSILC